MKIVVNRALCEGNGDCVTQAPELFRLDDEDELHVLRESFGAGLRAKAEAAVRACPRSALSIED